MTAKEEFISIYTENIKRKGADKLLEFLKKSDFFKAPSSTRYHSAYEGGLVQHSVNVYHCLKDYLSRPRTKEMYHMDFSEETIAIVALLHDVCKIDFYDIEMRNRKNEDLQCGKRGKGKIAPPQATSTERAGLPVMKLWLYAGIWDFRALKIKIQSEKPSKCTRLRLPFTLQIWKPPITLKEAKNNRGES